MATPTVFISYSHQDEEWKDRLVTHLGVLRQQGALEVWDDRRIEVGTDWHPEIEHTINAASVAVLMVSANFLTSNFILSEEVPRFFQRRLREGLRIFPVIIKPCAWKEVKWLSSIQIRPKDGRPLSSGNENQIDTDLAAIAEEIARIVKGTERVGASTGFVPLGPDRISTAKLPSTSPDLFGREAELATLDEAWADLHTNVLTLVAWGGVGKTALVGNWLSRLAADREAYRGAERIFGWSFYSQGAAEGRQVSADQFIAAALKWFGDPQMAESSASPWDKGERLAELIRQSRTLLVLDGLEPLQNPPPVETGRLKDPALSTLLRELARHNPGLVVITTRLAVDDLKDFTVTASRAAAKQSPSEQEIASSSRTAGLLAMTASATQIDLDTLSDEAGAHYLSHLGVQGTPAELRQASHDFGGHALALTLLGTYLSKVHRGDVRKRDLIAHLTDERKQGAHAQRVLASYERWLNGKAELDILRLMGLFDRPAERGAVEALRREPPIPSLTSNLQHLSSIDWQYAVSNLRDLRLLAAADDDLDTLDCHPLLREYFGEQLRTSNPKAWREAHSRLYEYYKTHAKEHPDTLEEMTPLFAAVMHGCQAGRHQEVLGEVYWQRVLRGNEHFSWKNLGAFGSDLVAVSNFFDSPWRQPIATLREDGKAFVLGQAGLYLRALGRLVEAAQPMQMSLDVAIAQEDWQNAPIRAGNLSELYLTMGDLVQALNYAQQSVELADRSGDAFQRMGKRTTLADALHQAGRLSEAEAAFHEAEEIQKALQPQFPLLYSLQGFRYCDLLLSQGKHQEVQSRVAKFFEWRLPSDSLLDVALEHLSLGRAYLQQAASLRSVSTPRGEIASPPTAARNDEALSSAATHLRRAVDGLRQASDQEFIGRGLLAWAELHRFTGAFAKALNDLDEAFAIATRGGMRLHEADCHLEYARLYVAMNDTDKARAHFVKAKQMVEEIGYHRRDGEVKELEEMNNEQ